MNFSESRFWLLLASSVAIVLGVRWILSRFSLSRLELYDRTTLAGIGLFLLACVSQTTFVIFCAVMVATYAGLAWILRQSKNGRGYLPLLILLQLSPLLFYKYGAFASREITGTEYSVFRDLMIPVGISFYTFQKISLVVDTLHFRQPLPRFLDYLNFACFFPQVVAGPIERRDTLLPQMERFRFTYRPESINAGAAWIVVGLFFKCCLADNLALHFSTRPSLNPFLIWLNNVIFGLRIYYDFAGYSFIAVGLAKCFGVDLTLNFSSPYLSNSPAEFWNRWHITLSRWFRDYIYIPLGGNRVRFWSFNVVLVFVISGIWHGAGWNFLVWGLLHGVLVIAARLWPVSKGIRPLLWVLTMLLVFFSWLFFYETDTDLLRQKTYEILNPGSYTYSAFLEAVRTFTGPSGFVLLSFLSISSIAFLLEFFSIRKSGSAYHLFHKPFCLVIILILTWLLAPGVTNDFIYFAF